MAINGADGVSRVNPSGKEVVYPGDRLIILGAKKDLNEASALIRYANLMPPLLSSLKLLALMLSN